MDEQCEPAETSPERSSAERPLVTRGDTQQAPGAAAQGSRGLPAFPHTRAGMCWACVHGCAHMCVGVCTRVHGCGGVYTGVCA